jgi:hypothetical protein
MRDQSSAQTAWQRVQRKSSGGAARKAAPAAAPRSALEAAAQRPKRSLLHACISLDPPRRPMHAQCGGSSGVATPP